MYTYVYAKSQPIAVLATGSLELPVLELQQRRRELVVPTQTLLQLFLEVS